MKINNNRINWIDNITPKEPFNLDFKSIDLAKLPAFSDFSKELDFGTKLSNDLNRDFSDLVEEIELTKTKLANLKPSVLKKLKQLSLDDLYYKIWIFQDAPEFKILNSKLNSIKDKLITNLSIDETNVFVKFYERFCLEIFRELYFSYLVLKNQSSRSSSNINFSKNRILNGRIDNMHEIKDFFDKDIQKITQRNQNVTRETGTYDRGVYYNSEAHKNHFHFINEALSDYGVLDIASSYTSLNMKLSNLTLHISSFDDMHIFQTFNDPSYRPKTINMHVDPKWGVIKLIIYLTETSVEDGPFCFVPGTVNLGNSVELNAAKSNGVVNYLQTKVERSTYAKLPSQLRVNSIFGSLIDDNTELSGSLLKNEYKLESSKYGNLFIFDAGLGIHRGGQPTKPGCKRIALQIALRPTMQDKECKGL